MIPPHSGPVARLVAVTVLVAVAVGASMLALTTLVLPGPWVREGLLGVALVAAAAAVVRGLLDSRARRRGETGGGSVVPTLVAIVVAAWFLLSRYGSPTSDPDLLVGPEHLSRVVARLGEAGEIVRGEVAPVPGTLPMALIVVGGTLTVLVLADALVGGLHWHAAAGLPLLALWAPPLVLVGDVPRTVFVVVVSALLLLLTVPVPRTAPTTRPPGAVRRAERSRAVLTSATAVVVALVAGVVASASSALPGYAGAWYQSFTTSGDAIQLAEDLDVLGSLTERSGEVVLTYTAPEDGVGPLRTYTASAFDGRRWQRGDERPGEAFAPDDLLWPDDVDRRALDGAQDVAITVGSLREDQLPVAVEPRTVTTDGTWGYDPVRDEVVGDRTDRSDTYALTVRPRDLGPEQLRGAGAGTAVDAYLEVPGTEHAEDVAEIALEVVGDADTAYDRAVALQQWLRDPARFTYSTQLPRGGTGDPVWDFLQHRTGYCVQFATTMTMMARTLGIPARLGVGFLPGDRVEEPGGATGSPQAPDGGSGASPEGAQEDSGLAVFEVTGQDSHAWPELYFEGVGWVRFEPTPSVQTGPPPQYTDPVSTDDAPTTAPQEVPTAQAEVPPTQAATAPTPTGAAVAPAPAATRSDPWPWVVAGAVTAVVVAVALTVLLARRRRTEGPVDAEQAWNRVVRSLARDGIRLPPATTPRQAPQAVVDAVVAARGQEPSADVRHGLDRLSAAVEEARYAPSRDDAAAPVDLGEVADTVVDGLTEQTAGGRASRWVDRLRPGR
ncbi:transglutaminase-like domain-containing protein [Isoptericola dokdonensis]|uniref:Transglutaminase-like superfamily protein n=1 Tax=Isoptericola dokdonensis DS-3 TaxID=1300344 RepID=A0A168EW55_9MICO|nr:transglutaminase-like domain-containing protein [Isoptericola dokdonensis]ANC30551.1 Transglutaminase-like superfamily protein [Isoptericola dokdonensis DS-3]